MTAAALQALVDQRARLVAQAGHLVDRARAASRDMNAEERQNFERMHDEAANLKAQIDAASASRGRAGQAGSAAAIASAEFARRAGLGDERLSSIRATEDYSRAFGDYVQSGRVSADLQADQSDKGGYMVPTEYANEIAKSLDNTFWFRQLANVLPRTTADSLQLPRRTARMRRFAWGAELTTPTKDTQLAFGQMTLTPGWMCGEIDVSNTLFTSGVVDVEEFVQAEITYAASETEEMAFMTGDGIRKPLGVFTPHADGVPASRDKVGTISTDDLYEAKFSLREPYLRSDRLAWLASRPFVRDVAKLKDSNNNPLWVVSVRAGEPDKLLGVPLTMSEYAPAGSGTDGAWASGDYAACIGDFKNYDVLDGLDMSVQRLNELEARRNMVVFIVRRKVAGCARHGEAFARLKIA
ncbi:phage major capsid protein [Limnoglobus roseus]|uniref:Phage major capsid protein n=1 Tax=Limnoglobus roseus TaxID=2598579 RepID=A0A5C1A5C5_9BACT|nr:phage major capsid protein [Limnoglobus roseus]QEL14339.1 phage major capsid protein [Limnoglobus roseus]